MNNQIFLFCFKRIFNNLIITQLKKIVSQRNFLGEKERHCFNTRKVSCMNIHQCKKMNRCFFPSFLNDISRSIDVLVRFLRRLLYLCLLKCHKNIFQFLLTIICVVTKFLTFNLCLFENIHKF
jgi:hypothetical protein